MQFRFRPALRVFSFLASTLVLVLPVLAASSDWPQWRGPQRDGHSPDSGLLSEWPEAGPSLVWQASGLGSGYSSLSVGDGRIYTMGDIDGKQFVLALDQNDGDEIWRAPIGPPWEDEYPGPRGTPTVSGDRLFVVSTEGDVVCLESRAGREIWRRSLPNDFGGSLMMARGRFSWKFAESPLVDGDRVIVTPGARDAALVALDRESGREIWRASVPELGEAGADGAGYSSAVVSEAAGVRQYVQLLGRGVVGIEASTGRFLWGYNKVANDVANIPTSIVSGDYVFSSSGYGTGAALLKLSRDGDGIQAEEVYFLTGKQFQNHHGGLILHEGHIFTGTGHNKGFPLALDMMSGQVSWGPVRNKGKGSAAASFADGHLYFRYQDGLVVLIEANPKEYREKGSFMIPNIDQFSWSHPVIAGGKLYLREQGNLYCYDVSAN